MSEKFIIKETIDSDGQRVIVYEFPGGSTRKVTGNGKGRRSRVPGSSFIKITFEEGERRETRGRLTPGSNDPTTS